jgi:glycosyltransferase involved in cell wall biosynthesis
VVVAIGFGCKGDMCAGCGYAGCEKQLCFSFNPHMELAAMRYGRPAIASPGSGVCGLIAHNRSGLLFKDKDAARIKREREFWKEACRRRLLEICQKARAP